MAEKRKHAPGPIRRPSRAYGKLVLTCSCGKRVTSTGNDDTLWAAHRKHERTALAREAAPDTTATKLITREITRAALHVAKNAKSDEELHHLEDRLRAVLLRLEEWDNG